MDSWPRRVRDRRTFLALLREIREEAGLRQEDLAARLNRTQAFVSKAERGDRRVDVLELRDICRACGTRLADFVRRFEERMEATES